MFKTLILKRLPKRIALLLLTLSLLISGKTSEAAEKLVLSAIPDQDPERLNRIYQTLCDELSNTLNVPVVYKPVTNYTAAVTAFRTGDLDLVWFGGLTGVQARLQTKGAKVLVQRDIDANFRSVFIANSNSKLSKFKSIEQLQLLKGRRFTFGSESSTSGRLMPQYFLSKANVNMSDFKGGRAGFSGSHDATYALVLSGSYETGVLNEQVWKRNQNQRKFNATSVKFIWRTPEYFDYHWLVQPNLDERFGKGFTIRLKSKFLNMHKGSKQGAEILKMFGSNKFISSKEENYKEIEEIARKLGKIK